MRTLRRVLIANRGEIAVRIARGARASGIVPLGIYSAADAGAMHLDAMDDAAYVGPAPAARSYLDIGRVVDAALALRADAVHPGYGFLSERAPFAAAVRAAGLVFVGPSPASIAAMGDKTEAKRRARDRGVPVVPGYDGDDDSLETLRARAAEIGTPLLIKASAGGGGRGMRVVDDLATFDEALEAARREALAAFGDARVLLERYLSRPRHVEFQIVADAFGTTVHLGERECSIQRRHQKIVEEAPSVALDPGLRERMGDAAVRVARSVGYENAGTVEFLVDASGAFYFLEMNARLQVEHPVTELVHGIDLVRLQFAIAAGAPLPFERAPAGCGHAIEARINAEDPARDFLPAAGTLARFDAPAGEGIRIDAGVRAGSTVSVYYDSLMAKLIAYGPDRATAAARLADALAAMRIDGVRSNLALLEAIARDPAFLAGDTTTAFLHERADALRASTERAEDAALELAVAAVLTDPRAWRIGGAGIAVRLRADRRAIATTGSRTSGDANAWRLDGDFAGDVAIERTGARVVLRRGDARLAGRATLEPGGIAIEIDGTTRYVAFTSPPVPGGGGAARSGSGAVVAPMPGTIARVAVRAGDRVEERDLLVVLEAMKMEHRIEATRGGTVASVGVAAGALVAGGATLVEIV